MGKYKAFFWFKGEHKFAIQEIIDFPKHEISIIAPTGTGKRWVYRLERIDDVGLENKKLDIPGGAMTPTPSSSKDGIDEILTKLLSKGEMYTFEDLSEAKAKLHQLILRERMETERNLLRSQIHNHLFTDYGEEGAIERISELNAQLNPKDTP